MRKIFYYIARLLKAGNLPLLSTLCHDIQAKALDFEDDPCGCCGKLNVGSPQTMISKYLQAGGTAQMCLEGLCRLSLQQDEKAGDDTFHWSKPDIPGWDFALHYKALPRCGNDSEFGFVLSMLLEH